jgi:cytidylate kinase
MKPIRVITIAREYGSGGAAIGQQVADRLGWKLLDRELIVELARRAHIPPSEMQDLDECPSSFIARTLKAFWLGNMYVWSSPSVEIADPDRIVELTSVVIHEGANLGQCVIVGRGAQCVLRGRDDTFHVFVYGSRQEKLNRIQHRHPSAECEAALAEFDRRRAAHVRQYYKCEWTDPHLYHLMINSDLGLQRAVSLILSATQLTRQELRPLESSAEICR